jgi:hypothetical protein
MKSSIPSLAILVFASCANQGKTTRTTERERPNLRSAVHDRNVIRLGGWNIKKLGHGTSKDYDTVAKINDDNFDIVAAPEVMQYTIVNLQAKEYQICGIN